MDRITNKSIENIIRNYDVYKALLKIEEFERTAGREFRSLKDKYTKRKLRYEKEFARINEMSIYEKKAKVHGFHAVAGIDEVGRGPLAGPVVSAAVILPEGIFLEKINDSKKISAGIRERLYEEIMENAEAVGIGIVDEQTIDDINILNATKKAALIALAELKVKPDLLLIDAFRLEESDIKQKSIIKGDSKSISIAAASIVAKVTRDRMMKELADTYPFYGFERNMGYGTAEHINAIKEYGSSTIHRKTFIKNFV